MEMIKKIIPFFLIISTAMAATALVNPAEETRIDPVGPGQEIILKFNRSAGKGVDWDTAQKNKGVDWETNVTKTHEYLFYHLKTPKGVEAGSYTFQVSLIDEQGLKSPVNSVLKVYLTRNPEELINVSGLAEKTEVQAGKNSSLEISLKNKAKARANYTLLLSIPGFPSFDEKETSVEIPSESTVRKEISFNPPEKGRYEAVVKVRSEANPKVNTEVKKKIVVKPSLKSKLKNIGRGFPLAPMTLSPFYAVIGLFGI